MISIIIPTLNEEGVISRTIRKLKEGLGAVPHEIIVSDGGSKDKTARIAEGLGVKVFVDPKPGTIAKGRNEGAKRAAGAYLVFLDADVFIPDPEGFFKRLIGVFESKSEVVAATVGIRVLRELETRMDRLVFSSLNLFHLISNNIFNFGRAAGEFQMIRSRVFKELGGYREDLAASEDYDLFSRLSKVGRVLFVRGLTVYHTGRRAHKIGWPRLLLEWSRNAFMVTFFKRSHSKKWEVVR
ncbi:MAG: glycosyl transferase family protein [Parcubacteria group bacterium Gr01-1014_20]|nr:MAG: glycosyl transferase family protein [Parcubacteria group bacterium Gr01-1014_20]